MLGEQGIHSQILKDHNDLAACNPLILADDEVFAIDTVTKLTFPWDVDIQPGCTHGFSNIPDVATSA